MIQVCPEYHNIKIIKSDVFTLSDFLNISGKYLSEILKNYWQLYKALASRDVTVLVPIW